MNRFHNNVVLVTGAGRGIGRATAEAFAAEGAALVLAGRTQAALDETADLIMRRDGTATTVVTDVTDRSAVSTMVDAALERYGALDVAVNNAGVQGPYGPVMDLVSDEWSATVDVNLTGVFNAMQAEIRHMRANGGGVIVNVASTIGAHMRLPNLGAYAATKAAVSALTRVAALEEISNGIRINAISPGPVDTSMTLLPGETAAQRTERMAGALPIGRVATRGEIAAAVLWLASSDASFTVGHDLVIDGAATA